MFIVTSVENYLKLSFTNFMGSILFVEIELVMKNLIILFITISLLACENQEKEIITDFEQTEVEGKNLNIIGKWVVVKKVNSSGDKYMKYNDTDIILEIKENGYFIKYDVLKIENAAEKGLGKIELRNNGQWSLDEDKLTLTYLDADKEKTELLEISRMKGDSLVTKNKEKDILTYYSISRK